MNDHNTAPGPTTKVAAKWLTVAIAITILAAPAILFFMIDRAHEPPEAHEPLDARTPIEVSIKYSWINERWSIPTITGGWVKNAHTYVVASDPSSGRSFVTRAGPETSCDKPGLEITSRSRTVSSVSESGTSSRTCPRFCRQSVSGLHKLWAHTYEGTDECDGAPVFVQIVGRIHEPFEQVVSKMRRNAERNNECNENRYRPFNVINETNNSNSYAFEVAQRLIGKRPKPSIPAPDLVAPGVHLEAVHGWDEVVGDNGVSCLGPDPEPLSRILSKCGTSMKWFLNPFGSSYNYCHVPLNRWIGGSKARDGSEMYLFDVIRQVSKHFRLSGNSRLISLSKNTEFCLRTYWDRPFHQHDYCKIRVVTADQKKLWRRNVGEHRVTVIKVVNVSAQAATGFSRSP